MRKWLICIALPLLACSSYKSIHNKAILVDTHNDILWESYETGVSFDRDLKGKTHSDINRWKQGGLDVQLFSIFCDGNMPQPYAFANRQLDSLHAIVNRNTDRIVMVNNSTELMNAVRAHKIAAMAGVEGGHMMEGNLENLTKLYNRGVRYMTLTWNNSTAWATSGADETSKKNLSHRGLTDFGRQVVRKMNELGMIVDVSHVGEQTFWDAINTTTKPVIASHSCVYVLCPVSRNLKDDQINAIGKNGGVIHLNFYSGFIDSTFDKRTDAFYALHSAEVDSLKKVNPEKYFRDAFLFSKYPAEVASLRPPLSLLVDHLDYIVKLIGVDHVGIGSDFDGVSSLPRELNDVTDYPLITRELVKRGYSKKDINKMLGGNFLRVLQANESR